MKVRAFVDIAPSYANVAIFNIYGMTKVWGGKMVDVADSEYANCNLHSFGIPKLTFPNEVDGPYDLLLYVDTNHNDGEW